MTACEGYTRACASPDYWTASRVKPFYTHMAPPGVNGTPPSLSLLCWHVAQLCKTDSHPFGNFKDRLSFQAAAPVRMDGWGKLAGLFSSGLYFWLRMMDGVWERVESETGHIPLIRSDI